MRRDFALPEEDQEFLEACGLPWETVQDGGNRWCILRQHPVPAGLNAETCSIAIKVESTYLSSGLDMAYFSPALARRDGRGLPAVEAFETICGSPWQRWSRHYPWRAGKDSLATHILQIRHWLEVAAAP